MKTRSTRAQASASSVAMWYGTRLSDASTVGIRQGGCAVELLEFLWKLLHTCKHERDF
jgi:hypothetical protein